jgi:peroxiredoxin family protein
VDDQDTALTPSELPLGPAAKTPGTAAASTPGATEMPAATEKMTIVVHSGDFDKIYSAFIIGDGALAMGMEVSLYFTFWALMRLKKGALDSGPLSKMNMLGLGKLMVRRRMKKAGVVSLDRLAEDFKALGGKIFACDMTMDIMGIEATDLRQDLIEEYCAVGTYVEEARNSTVTLFI